MIRSCGDAQQASCAVVDELPRLNFHGLLRVLEFPEEALRQRVRFHIAAQLNVLALRGTHNHHLVGAADRYKLHLQQEVVADCLSLGVERRARVLAGGGTRHFLQHEALVRLDNLRAAIRP
jgi:hypothetical protein